MDMTINRNEEQLLRHLLRGRNSIIVDYNSTTEVLIKRGFVHINNGSIDDIFDILTEFTLELESPSTDTWYYVMASIPEKGKVITSDDISITDTEPSLDESKRGYYSSDGLSRCIGVCFTDGSSNVREFKFIGGEWRLAGHTTKVNKKTEASWTEFDWGTPFDNLIVFGSMWCYYRNNWNRFYYSADGVNRQFEGLYCMNASEDNGSGPYFFTTGKSGWYMWWSATTNEGYISFAGFVAYPWLYNP